MFITVMSIAPKKPAMAATLRAIIEMRAMKKRHKTRVFRSLRHPASLPMLLDFHRSAAILVRVRQVGIWYVLIGRELETHER